MINVVGLVHSPGCRVLDIRRMSRITFGPAGCLALGAARSDAQLGFDRWEDPTVSS